jgi:uncharacterized iron-regulated protein
MTVRDVPSVMWSWLALGVLFIAPACASSSEPHPSAAAPAEAKSWQSKLDLDHPLVGTIWDVATKRRVDEGELIARLQASDVLLVGETHDNPDHHLLEARLIEAFAARHAAPAVVFEMIDRDKQAAVDASLGAQPEDVDALAKAVDWASSGWPAWSMYRPVFQSAVSSRGPLLAAGVDRAASMRIARDGVAAFDPSLDDVFGLNAPLPPAEQGSLRDEIREAHCGLLPDEMLDSMVSVQRVRDALFAERLHAGSVKAYGAVLIAGAGHVRRDRGVPAQLAHAYHARSLAVALLEVRAKVTTPYGYAEDFHAASLPFDFVWFTPRGNDIDHCAELRAHMKAHRP